MKRYLFFLMLGLILSSPGAVLAELEIKAEVDKDKLTAAELLTYKLTLTLDEKNVSQLQFPKFQGFDIISQAQSTTISFVKSNIKKLIEYTFILAPKEHGEFKIESAQIKFKGKIYQSQAFKIEVKPGRTEPQVRPKAKPPSPEKPLPESEEPQITL